MVFLDVWVFGLLGLFTLLDPFGLLAVYSSPWDSFHSLASGILPFLLDLKVGFSLWFTSNRQLAVPGVTTFSYDTGMINHFYYYDERVTF